MIIDSQISQSLDRDCVKADLQIFSENSLITNRCSFWAFPEILDARTPQQTILSPRITRVADDEDIFSNLNIASFSPTDEYITMRHSTAFRNIRREESGNEERIRWDERDKARWEAGGSPRYAEKKEESRPPTPGGTLSARFDPEIKTATRPR